MKIKFVAYSMILLIIFSLAGCANTQTTQTSMSEGSQLNTGNISTNNDDNQNTDETKLEEKIKQYIEQNNNFLNKKVSSIKIISTNIIAHGMLIFALYQIDNDSESYQGLFRVQQTNIAQDNVIIDGALDKIDKSVPFTKIEMGGDAAIKGEQKKTYFFIGGVINNNNIKAINIQFDDGLLVSVQVDSYNTYNYARTDKLVGITSIEAVDKDGISIQN